MVSLGCESCTQLVLLCYIMRLTIPYLYDKLALYTLIGAEWPARQNRLDQKVTHYFSELFEE